MRRKVLFLHGFFASGACTPALALREALADEAEVLSPDLPLHPNEALEFIKSVIASERPTLLIGNSNGSFLAQLVAKETGLPALLGNPHFEMTKFLSERIGAHEYKSPRADGRQRFVIDQALIDEFAALQDIQFQGIPSEMRGKVWGIFGEKDAIAHYEHLFAAHYDRVFHFPGGHTPTAEETKEWYAPIVRMMGEFFWGEEALAAALPGAWGGVISPTNCSFSIGDSKDGPAQAMPCARDES